MRNNYATRGARTDALTYASDVSSQATRSSASAESRRPSVAAHTLTGHPSYCRAIRYSE
jgi:hypothetical protein